MVSKERRSPVADRRAIHFGYNPPTGDRLIERVDPATFVGDLDRVLTVAAPSFDSIWVSDHLMTGDRFRMECWTQLTWIAARFPGPQLGTIVMANSYRHPSLLAKMASSLHHLSRGRLILGYGAGWAEDEYRAYGYDFPSARIRIEQMVEGIEVIRALWQGGPATYHGRHYRLEDALSVPRSTSPPQLMIGGDGEKLLLRAVAEHADIWNSLHRPIPILRRKLDVLDEHCAAVGRDPAAVRRSVTFVAHLHRDAAVARRAAGDSVERDAPAFAGDPQALIDHLATLVDLGFDMFQLVFPRFPETDDLELFLEEVRPAFT
jgi:alkanesulfonate monooxygenase SsuD/methylene tetrahydromethanopterin reductase-like flavin-dependent oxidoreductase (luciferase family)